MAATESFVIKEHQFEGQHIREYPKALANSQEDTILLHARSYTPREVADGSVNGDLTIIAFHANGFPKEVYEPFFEALYQNLKRTQGLTVGSIWIADQASQGISALLNDDKLGNDPSWFDHSRDVLAMTNTFRKQMTRPIYAVGHSMGGAQAVTAAHLHPRLFEGVVLIDPAISISSSPSLKGMLKYTLRKPESYPAITQAEEHIRKLPFFKIWDHRALQRYIDTAFHSSPTIGLPNERVKPTTSKHAETTTLIRPNTQHSGLSEMASDVQRASYPNVDPEAPLTGPVYNPHIRIAWSHLLSLRPAAFLILGEGSQITQRGELLDRTRVTGTAPGGSGGVAAGKVKMATISGGHFLPMTNISGTAEATGEWLAVELQRYREREEAIAETWKERSLAEKQKLEPEVEKVLTEWDGKPWVKAKTFSEKSRL